MKTKTVLKIKTEKNAWNFGKEKNVFQRLKKKFGLDVSEFQNGWTRRFKFQKTIFEKICFVHN